MFIQKLHVRSATDTTAVPNSAGHCLCLSAAAFLAVPLLSVPLTCVDLFSWDKEIGRLKCQFELAWNEEE